MINITLSRGLRLCITLFVFLSSVHTYGQSSLQVVQQRCAQDALSMPTENKSVSQILGLMRPDGSFTDRNYDIFIVDDRILKLAQAYTTDPRYQNDQDLKNAIYLSWDHWNNNYDLPTSLAEWTVKAFRLPRAQGLLANLMIDDLKNDYNSNPQAKAISDYVNSLFAEIFTNDWGRPGLDVGANFSSRLRGGIYIAAFSEDPEKLQEMRDRVDEAFELGAGTQTQIIGYPHAGLTPDFSFHQHNRDGGQNIWGNYGNVWLDEIGKVMKLVSGTELDFTTYHYDRLYNGIAEGLRYFIYREEITQLVTGRRCFNNFWGGGFARSVERIMNGMAPGSLSKERMDELVLIEKQFRDKNEPATQDKSKVFYTSDMLVHARPNNHVVVKMLSNRTASLELGIGPKTKSYHLGDGTTLFRIEGHEYEQSFAVSNVTSWPGATIEQKSGAPENAKTGTTNSNNTFAGGVSDDRSMVGAFDLNKAQSFSSIRANKAYFFHDDIFGFLGNGVRQDGPINGEIWTTLNQVERKTDITYNLGGSNRVVRLGSSEVRDFNNITSPVWFYQDGFGYIIVPEDPVDIKFWAEERTGAWSDVNSKESSKPFTVNMFQLVINHGRNPQNDKYQYYVIPNTTPNEVSRIVRDNPFEIISNNMDQSVMYHRDLKKGQFVFYKGNQRATLSSGLEIFSEKPSILQTTETADSLILFVNDPNQAESAITLRANIRLIGNGATWDANNEESVIQVDLPTGIYKGQRVRMAFALNGDLRNASPYADFTYSADSLIAPARVSFDAGSSNDPDGSIASYEWDFGDGSQGTGARAEKVYNQPGTYIVVLSVRDDSGAVSTLSKSIDITEYIEPGTCELPKEWFSTDIGNVPVEGSACAANNTFTITASGGDIWGTSDEFHYMYRPMYGDGEMIVRVASMEMNTTHAKVGIMMRDNLDPTSQHAHVCFNTRMLNHSMQFRELPGDETYRAGNYSRSSEVSFPYWVRLTRSGNTFRGYMSPDGSNWELVGEISIAMGAEIYGGITTTNKDFNGTTTSEVDNLTFSQSFNPGTFPVEFIDFEAIPRPQFKQVDLKWETASELNNSHFVVQRSLDGRIFDDLMNVNGQGNSNSSQKYQAADTKPVQGKLFYRLKQVDFGGTFSFSNVVEINYDGELNQKFTMYPNPINQGNMLQVNLFLEGVPEVTVRIRNAMGQVIYRRRGVQINPNGEMEFQVPTGKIYPGRYLISIFNPKFMDAPISRRLIVRP